MTCGKRPPQRGRHGHGGTAPGPALRAPSRGGKRPRRSTGFPDSPPIIGGVPEGPHSDAELNAALEALSDPDRFREAETRVAQLAPQLQRILGQVLHEGGWFGEAHESQVLKVATTPGEDERIVAVQTLIAEETRVAMMVGVAVGWELARELDDDAG